MNLKSPRQQVFTLKYSFVQDELSALKCRDCKGVIDIHQPNPAQPERILGTCSKCGSWYLIEPQTEGDRTMVLQLPDLAEISHPAVGAT